MVNGKRICNVDTMTALQRMGLVIQDDHRCWKATQAGREITKTLDL
jgi:Mn-dependent DtxR family transcriptional regulator